MPSAISAAGVVVRYPKTGKDDASGHENVSRAMIAGRLAAMKGYDYAENYGPHCGNYPHVYFVPDETLTATQARALSIFGEEDMFGGVVPHAFVATKLITHPLFDDSQAPAGWSHELGGWLENAVLPGYSAFRLADARRAGLALLEQGRVRVKVGWGVGGRGQQSVANAHELQQVLDELDPAAVSSHGVVLELDLDEDVTLSVGQIKACGLQVSYYGQQRTTPNSKGENVYGGSSLILVRGGFSELLSLKIPAPIVDAIGQVRQYDAAVSRAYPGFFASRRNYDVIQGRDAQGKPLAGVLEQSWRVGGASPAEMAALEAFIQDPALNVVRASCVEIYGEHQPPEQAVVHFCDIDRRVGQLTKYSIIENYEDPA